VNDNAGSAFARAVARMRRILVVDPNPATAKMLAELLRSVIPQCQVSGVQTDEQGFRHLESFDPQLIFIELKGPSLDGLAFTRRLRRSYLACREVPVILITAEATAAAITGARDAGVHEFLRRPFTLGDLKKRIEAILLRPRDWIEAVNYVGPDRRRFNSADYKGPRKRGADGASPVAQRILQAIKIAVAADAALSTDPRQAHRALKAQARILAQLSAGKESLKRLEAVALALDAYLSGPAAASGLQSEQVNRFVKQLAEAAPQEQPERAA